MRQTRVLYMAMGLPLHHRRAGRGAQDARAEEEATPREESWQHQKREALGRIVVSRVCNRSWKRCSHILNSTFDETRVNGTADENARVVWVTLSLSLSLSLLCVLRGLLSAEL